MSQINDGLVISLDPSWTSSTIATAILERVRSFYGDSLDIDAIHAGIDEIWLDLQKSLSDEEKRRTREVSHVAVPLNDFNARIVTPVSRQGYFILFDSMLEMRLGEIFTAPRNIAAWTAAYVRAAWGDKINVPHWVKPAFERLHHLGNQAIPDSYSLETARNFIFAHECGHLFRDHLSNGAHRMLHFASTDFLVFDPALKQEVEADASAREILCRSDKYPLTIQQMGVDWLFGFMGAVLAMRRRAQARREGDTDLPEMDEGIALRRALSWSDHNRRRAESPNEQTRSPENEAALDHVRQTVDNYNNDFPGALADIYAEFPDELMSLQTRVVSSSMTETEIRAFQQDLASLSERAVQRQGSAVRKLSWGKWLRRVTDRWF